MTKKICFVSHNIYPLLKNVNEKVIGGAGLQQLHISRELHKQGYEVSFITGIFSGNEQDEIINGLKVYKTYAPDSGLRFIKFIYPRIWKLWQALKRADADIYYQRCSSFSSGIIALFCKLYKKSYIFAGAHNRDFIPNNTICSKKSRPLYFYGLKNAKTILVQSKDQQELLFKNFKKEGTIIKNIFPESNLATNRKYILWVGRITSWKRPEIFLQMAKSYPDETFVMIGGEQPGEHKYYQKILKMAGAIKNVKFLGFLPFNKADQYFNQAKVFVNTSTAEGFPNTFLQAWSRGIPTISFFDPDNVITSFDLGYKPGNIDDAKKALHKFMDLPIAKREKIREYFKQNHSVNSFTKKFMGIIKN